jgi:putative oxidoreductase
MSATITPQRHPGDTDDVTGRARAHAVEPGRSLLQRLVHTEARLGPAIARLGLGLVILPHALQKTLGLFGGYGFSGTYDAFTKQMGLPGWLAVLAIVGELVGSLLLIVGFLTRIGAIAIIAMMLGAVALVHLPHGFFMNWQGALTGEGFEYHILAITLGLVALIHGGGRASVDHALMKWRPAEGGSVSPSVSPEAP